MWMPAKFISGSVFKGMLFCPEQLPMFVALWEFHGGMFHLVVSTPDANPTGMDLLKSIPPISPFGKITAASIPAAKRWGKKF